MTMPKDAVTGKVIIIDPIPFRGGSKIATEAMLNQLAERMPGITFHALTADPTSWLAYPHYPLWVPSILKGRESGFGYLLKQMWQAIAIFWLVWRLKDVKCLLAASGPGVDLCCYWAAILLRCMVVQFIHGPVGCSGLSARALRKASAVFYLESAQASLKSLMLRLGDTKFPSNWKPFINGLREAEWPTMTSGGSRILWAASLLRWKGLETMLTAHQMISSSRPELTICYLQPTGTQQPCSQPRPELPDTYWYPNPPNLDELRAMCGIFVSTSMNEPFGLSILEAMAAGLCVVLPADGAWWDQHLIDGVDCIKYQPNDPDDLARALMELNTRPDLVTRLGGNARLHAISQYNAMDTYQGVIKQIECMLE